MPPHSVARSSSHCQQATSEFFCCLLHIPYPLNVQSTSIDFVLKGNKVGVILFSFQGTVKKSTPSVPKRSRMHLDFNDLLGVSFIRKEVSASCLVENETPESDNTQHVARSLDATLRCLSINETFASIQEDPFASEPESQTESTSSVTSSDEETCFSTRQALVFYRSSRPNYPKE